MRYTKKDIQWRLDRLNSLLGKNKIQMNLEGRYGYNAIDLYSLNGECEGTVMTGMTKTQIAEHLDSMEKGIKLFKEGYL